MEACVRGFSFMPEGKIEINEVMELQYIEEDELERTWKSSRRERMKQREQKIWDEFVQEQDILSSVCKDDPYQFLENLPEPYLMEMMESELQKMKQEVEEESKNQLEIGKSEQPPETQHVCSVISEETNKEDTYIFHIFEEDQDLAKADEQSGPEEEDAQNESPCTVRAGRFSRNHSPEGCLERKSSKSSDNVTNVIESSIYCARLKELRMRIRDEMLAMATSLENTNVLTVELEDITRMCRRSAEFCGRFSRIHLYQLQRQMHDVKRNNCVALPFAKHTQFQSQMIRIVTLHQNLLQSCMVFHKSFDQTACLGESTNLLATLVHTVRDANALCASVPPPKDFTAAQELYKDDLLSSCEKLEEMINNHILKSREIFFANTVAPPPKRTIRQGRKRFAAPNSKLGSKTDAEARLSMYSLDTRMNSKSSSSKDNHSGGTSKIRLQLSTVGSKRLQADKNDQVPKSQRKSPRVGGGAARSRRPLMRDPHAGRPRAPRPPRDAEITTMVEGVEACASSHISREPSLSAFRSKETTPRSFRTSRISPKKVMIPTPRTNVPTIPSTKLRLSPRARNTLETDGTNIKGDGTLTKLVQIMPASKILNWTAKRSDNKLNPKNDLNLTGIDVKESIDNNQRSDRNVRNDARNHFVPKNKEKKEVYYKNEVLVDYEVKTGEGRIESTFEGIPSTSYKGSKSPKLPDNEGDMKAEKDWARVSSGAPAQCEVTRIIKQLCSGDGSGSRSERTVGAKNAQLVCVSGGSPRQPTTPQLLRILEETIQKKVPKPLFQKPSASPRDIERFRLVFNISEKTADNLFQYRTKFVQHMLSSPMYANSAVGKPWEMIGSVSEQIIDELLLSCAKEMELESVLQEMFRSETN